LNFLNAYVYVFFVVLHFSPKLSELSALNIRRHLDSDFWMVFKFKRT